MPVTITLSDDAALELMSQIGGQVGNILARRGGEAVAPPAQIEARGARLAKIEKALKDMPKGTQFRVPILAHELGLKSNSLSAALTDFKNRKIIDMVRRGTWKKI